MTAGVTPLALPSLPGLKLRSPGGIAHSLRQPRWNPFRFHPKICRLLPQMLPQTKRGHLVIFRV